MNFCNKVAGTLIRNAIKTEKNTDNVVVSPLSFNIVLNMAARNLNGRASELLGHLLDLINFAATGGVESDPLPSNKKRRAGGFTLRYVSKALHDKAFPLQPSFHQLVTQVYEAEVEQVDFQFGDRPAIVNSLNSWVKRQTEGAAVNSVTSWVKRQTEGLEPPKIIGNHHVNPSTRLLLLSAQYFNGKWVDPFMPKLTEDREFQLLDGKTVKIPFMSGCKHYYHSEIDDFDLIRIPYYRNGDLSMYIFLPTETQEFQQFLRKVGSENLLLDQDFRLKRSVGRKLWIPKFNIQYNTDKFPNVLSDILKSSISNTPLLADNIVHQPYDEEDLFVGYIVQNSVIKVDEAGTVAGSATCLGGITSLRPPPPLPPIVVDRPFVFMIREEKHKLTLYLGAVTHPHT